MRSLRTQLLVSHLLIVLLVGIVLGGAVTQFFRLGRSIDRVLAQNYPTTLAAQAYRESLRKQQFALTLLARGDLLDAPQLYRDASLEAAQALATIAPLLTERDEIEIFARLRLEDASLRSLADDYVRANSLSPQLGAAEALRMRLAPRYALAEEDAGRIADVNAAAIVTENANARRRAERSSYYGLGVTVLALVLASFLAYRMMRLALTPLAMIEKQAERIAAGDLTAKLEMPRRDEIGTLADSFNEMASKLAEVRTAEARRIERLERMSDAALDSLYDPVLVVDAKARIVQLNGAARALFGPAPRSPRPALGEHVADKRIVSAVEKVLKEGEVSAIEDERAFVPLRVDGGERIYRLRVTPMRDAERTLGAVSVLEDVTHLRVLDRMKTEFIGVAAHELRTPVASLLLAVQLLEEGALGDLAADQREVVGVMRQDLDRLEKLMRDLLDVTNLESGLKPPRPSAHAPQELLSAVEHLVRTHAERKGVEFVVEKNGGLPSVLADRSQVTRVLANLANNAIRHTDSGGRIELRASDGGDHVTFSVADTGEGIPEEYRKRIFERFVQVPGATQGGAGLGLSIALNIVRAHGGEMSVDSEVGRGSVFRFTLPTAGSDGANEA